MLALDGTLLEANQTALDFAGILVHSPQTQADLRQAIALSDYASEADRQRSLSTGFDRHLNKPIDLSSPIKAITD